MTFFSYEIYFIILIDNFLVMARPCIERIIEVNQKYTCFSPSNSDIKTLEKIELKTDELEALRLAEIEEMDMNSWAKKMWISAPTFCRLVKKARKKIADFIINWKRLRVYK